MPAAEARIPALEARLARDPDDLETCYLLALLHDRAGQSRAQAHHYYLLHLVRSLGYADVGSALVALEAKSASRDCPPAARLLLGQVYGYLDRRAEAARELGLASAWHRQETAHFALHSVPDSVAYEAREEIAWRREQELTRLLALFEMAEPPARPIVHYYYESLIHKEILTGDRLPAHVFIKQGEVHAVYGEKMKIGGPHEDAHVVLGRLGRTRRFLEEGAAEYASHGQRVHDRFKHAPQAAVPRVSALLEDEVFAATDPFVSYALAASFVGRLIASRGAAAFKLFYAAAAHDPTAAARRHYGVGLDDLEAAWRQDLSALPAVASEDADAPR